MQPLKNPKYQTLLLGLWSIAEAIGWFILPDVLLFPLSILDPTRTQKRLIIAWAASLIGSIAMMLLCHYQPDFCRQLIFSLPWTYPEMLPKLQVLEKQYGILLGFIQAYSGVPLKVWIYADNQQLILKDQGWFYLLLATGYSRFTRMFLTAFIGQQIGIRLQTDAMANLKHTLIKYWPALVLLYATLIYFGLEITSHSKAL
jgi:hypothetical protein